MTKRDYEIIEFIEKFKVATTSQIQKKFFKSISACRRRLKILSDNNLINKKRYDMNSDYVYFIKEPKQVKHSLEVTNFYINFPFNITNYKIEPNLRKYTTRFVNFI